MPQCPDQPYQLRRLYQYGSAERGTPDPDPEYFQDGVAAQCPVKGLSEKALLDNKTIPDSLKSHYGRAYYPKNKPTQYPRGFINSHRIGHYGWIFDEEVLSKEDRGYVKPK